jgi:hypothetical protein
MRRRMGVGFGMADKDQSDQSDDGAVKDEWGGSGTRGDRDGDKDGDEGFVVNAAEKKN